MKTWGFFSLCLLIFVHCDMLSEFQLKSFKNEIILKQEAALSAPALILLHNQNLLLAYSVQDSTAGEIKFMSSDNKGNTWKLSETSIKTAWHSSRPHLCQINDNLILLHFTMFHSDSQQPAGCFLVYSYDYGRTFTVPRKISTDILYPCETAGDMLELQNGKLLIPVLVHRDENLVEPGLLSSTDRGETWKYSSFFRHMDMAFMSPSLVLLNNGDILCQLESENHRMLFQTLSQDGGETWHEPVPVQIYGDASEIFMLPSGILLSVYQDETPPGMSVITSFNSGKTWQDEMPLHSQNTYRGLSGVLLEDNLLYFAGQFQADNYSYYEIFHYQPLSVDAPKGFSAAAQDSLIKLRWNAIPEAHYYQIFKSINDSLVSPEPQLLIASTSENMVTDRQIRSGETYFYGIRAVYGEGPLVENSGGQSPLSQIIHIQIKTEETNDF